MEKEDILTRAKLMGRRLSVIVFLSLLLLGFGSAPAYAGNVTAEVIGSGAVWVEYPCKEYRIIYSHDGEIKEVISSETHVEITGLENGKVYTFTVIAMFTYGHADVGTSNQVIPTAFAESFEVDAPETAGAGDSFDVTLCALDSSGALETDYVSNHTINLNWDATPSPYGMMPEMPNSPVTLKFTGGTATLSGFKLFNAGETPVITVTDNKDATGSSGPITVQHQDPVMTVDLPALAIKSQPQDITVKVLDPYGNTTKPLYIGDINLTSTDSNAILPSGIKFSSDDKNVKVVPNAVIFNSIGLHTITATGDNLTGQKSIRVETHNKIAAGSKHSLAVKADGSVVAWGDNYYHQCETSGFHNVVSVAAGDGHSLFLKGDGTVAASGRSYENQCTVPSGLDNVVKIAAKGYNSLALKSDGTVVAWGSQARVPDGLKDVVDIACTSSYSLTLQSDGRVKRWGVNVNGNLWEEYVAGWENVISIASGTEHYLALKSDGTVMAKGGNNYHGETNVPPGLNNVIAIAAGYEHSLALKSDGTVIGWGSNSHGQTSDFFLGNNVVAISAGNKLSISLKADGTVNAGGLNSHEQATVPSGLNLSGKLSSLTINHGNFTPTFSPDTLSYDLTVASTINSLNIKGELSPDNPQALLKINGEAAESGVDKAVALNVGVNTIPVAVITPADGLTRTYKLIVNKLVAAETLVITTPSKIKTEVPFDVTVEVQDFSGNRATAFTGTIFFKSSDPEAVLPEDYTFTEQDAGIKTFNITFHTPGDHTLTIAEPGAGGLLGYWKFDEGSGTQAQDASGNNYHGTLVNGPVWRYDDVPAGIKFSNPYALQF